MFKAFACVLLLFPVFAGAVSCPDYDKYSQSVIEHVELASDVFLGEIVRGEFDVARDARRGDQISTEIRVAHPFKGANFNTITVSASPESLLEPIAVGYSYLVFLYGDESLDSVCGYLIPFSYYINTLEAMLHWGPKIDDEHSKQRNEFLRFIREKHNNSVQPTAKAAAD